MAQRIKRLAILGSTGSIGTQTLDVARAFPDRLQVVALCAGRNVGLLAQQAREFRPRYVHCKERAALPELSAIECGSLEEIATMPDIDTVVVATVGSAGLKPTIAALEAGKSVALANKEVIIMAGEQVMAAARRSGSQLLPVDSEPTAIWQCLAGESRSVRRLLITASGGAFRGRSWNGLANVSPEEALRHPTWRMGRKITIDSATLVNKAFEVIEAHWLFGVPYRQIEVVIHRQSVIHSMVELDDGSVKAHLGPPDMRYPIQYALFYPEGPWNGALPRYDPLQTPALTFEKLDPGLYPCFGLALEYGSRKGTWGAALTGADEAAVEMFLAGKMPFTDIPTVIRDTLEEHDPTPDPDLDAVLAAADWASARARAGKGA